MEEKEANKSLAKVGLFLQELTKLTDEYKIAIKGCGCCGSPWLEDYEYGETYNDLYLNTEGKYTI